MRWRAMLSNGEFVEDDGKVDAWGRLKKRCENEKNKMTIKEMIINAGREEFIPKSNAYFVVGRSTFRGRTQVDMKGVGTIKNGITKIRWFIRNKEVFVETSRFVPRFANDAAIRGE